MVRSVVETKALFDIEVTAGAVAALGKVLPLADIKSTVGPFLTLPQYKTRYPEVIIQALGELYVEYNRAFHDLVAANREWDTDYRYCCLGGGPMNFAVQIDMVALTDGFLAAASTLPVEVVREVLRTKIFEIENSLAMYQFLERAFSDDQQSSVFKERFRQSLSEWRNHLGKPIALLAVTDQKYLAMMESEFGKNGHLPSDQEVQELSAFDRFMSPSEFRQHVADNNGNCRYLLYARTSDPLVKLKKPNLVVDHPLLSDPEMRRVIKAHALTLNIDAPGMEAERKINDTKQYTVTMGMAFPLHSLTDMLSPGFATHLANGQPYASYVGSRLSDDFTAYMEANGLSSDTVASGQALLRCKPMRGTYGCYGHVRGSLGNQKFRADLRNSLRQRGAYVVQPEMSVPTITNLDDQRSYTYIDRNFMAMDVHGRPCFLGGFRSLMPVDSFETHKGRNHGNGATVWAEIV